MIGGELTLTHREERDAIVVTPRGCLDVGTYPDLRDHLLKCAAEAPEAVVVDLGDLVADRVSILSVFPTVWMRTCVWPAVPLLLAGAGPPLDELLVRSAVPRFVPCHGTVREALDVLERPLPRRCAETWLPPDKASSCIARHWVHDQLTGFGVTGRENAVSVASELVENAVQHAGSPCRLRVELHPAGLSVAVYDDDPRPPVFLSPEIATADRCFGLALVAMLAQAWGHSPRWNGGKAVWAVLPVTDDVKAPGGPVPLLPPAR